MPYTVEILKRAEKFLRSINDAKLYRKIREAIDSLEMDPFPPGSKKLIGTLFDPKQWTLTEALRHGEDGRKSRQCCGRGFS